MTQHQTNDLSGLCSRKYSIWPKFFLKRWKVALWLLQHTLVWWERRGSSCTKQVSDPQPPQHLAMPALPHRMQSIQVCALKRTKKMKFRTCGCPGHIPYSSLLLLQPGCASLTTPELHIPQTFSFLLCFKHVFIIKIWKWPQNRNTGERTRERPQIQAHTMHVC